MAIKILEIRIKFDDSADADDVSLSNYGEIIKDRLYDEDEPGLIDVTYEVRDAETKD